MAALLVSVQSAGPNIVVEVSPVVLSGVPFSATLVLPPSFALKKGGVEAQASLVDGQGGQAHLAKRKLAISSGGEVILQHELEGLFIRCEIQLLRV